MRQDHTHRAAEYGDTGELCCSTCERRATASTAFMGAWKDVLAGTHELSFCIGIEKLFSPDAPERTAGLFNQGYITSRRRPWWAIGQIGRASCRERVSSPV